MKVYVKGCFSTALFLAYSGSTVSNSHSKHPVKNSVLHHGHNQNREFPMPEDVELHHFGKVIFRACEGYGNSLSNKLHL